MFTFKLQAFILGAVIMGVGGALFAHYVRFLSPLTFDPLLATFIIWAMLMVGGAGNNRGAILGAFVVWGIWTGTQFLPGVFSDPNFRFFHDRRAHRRGDPDPPRRYAGGGATSGAGCRRVAERAERRAAACSRCR